MKNKCMPLCALKKGEYGVVTDIEKSCQMKRRFQDLGLICGTKVQAIQQNSYKDISIYLIRGTMIAIRNDDAQNIFVI